jgi:hypothetical protein
MAESVTLIVDYNDGYTRPDRYTVEFEAGMDIEEAMKRAYDGSYGSAHPFSFVLSYFGSSLGYFVEAINGIQGNRVSGWALFLGANETPAGIDEEILTPGNVVTFRYLLDRDIHSDVAKAKKGQRSPLR